MRQARPHVRTQARTYARQPARPPQHRSAQPVFQRRRCWQRDVGIRFKGVEKTNVEEYCISEGWVRVAAGKALDRYGNPLTIKLTGPVEAWFKSKPPG